MNPRISVVFPVGPRKEFVAEALDSVLAQTFTDFELIAVLDGVPPEVSEVVTARRDERIRVVHLPVNMGLSNARNTGLKLARAPYIALMDSDDVALPHRLATQHAWLEEHPQVTVLGSNAVKLRLDGAQAPMRYPQEDGQIKARLLLVDGALIDPTTMYRTEFVRSHGIRYDASLPRDQDHLFWVEMMRRGAQFHGLQQELLLYRRHPGNLTQDRSRVDIEKSRVREALMPLFFPRLSGVDCAMLVKGMSQDAHMSVDDICKFIAALHLAADEGHCFFGEERSVVQGILGGYRKRVLHSLELAARGTAAATEGAASAP